MQGMEEICCRIGEPKRNAKVVLLFEDGTEEEYLLDTGEEARWESGGRQLMGGYTCAGGKLWLATGDEARSAYQRASMKRMVQSKKTENRPEEREKTGQQDDGKEDGKRTGGRREERTWPQRRWPPPPCWTDARYIHGCWQEANQ